MTMVIETITGEEIDTGFWGPDTSRIQLGNLPPMPTQQFMGYASRVLIEEVIPGLDAGTRAEWARDMHSLYQRIGSLPVMQTLNRTTDQQGQAAMLSMAVPLRPASLYPESPFRAGKDGRSVGLSMPGRELEHVVRSQDLFNLTSYVINGGFLGWDEQGAYEEVHHAATKLNNALSGSQ